MSEWGFVLVGGLCLSGVLTGLGFSSEVMAVHTIILRFKDVISRNDNRHIVLVIIGCKYKIIMWLLFNFFFFMIVGVTCQSKSMLIPVW